MARKPGNQHPAMGTQIAVLQQDDLDVGRLFQTDQWHGLGGREQEFLLKYVQYRDVRRAIAESGPEGETHLDMAWFDLTERSNSGFAWCVKAIMEHPKEVARHIMDEALCESAFLLVELMRNANPRVQLDAIKQLHHVASIGGAALLEGAGQHMNVQINMDAFTGELAKNGKVVDAT
jgi:hypothetical protein